MAGADRVLCANCERVLHEGDQPPPSVLGAEGEREPCPYCGATQRTIEKSLEDTVAVSDVSVTPTVVRGYNAERLALLALMLSVSLVVGIGVAWWAGIATFLAISIVFAIPSARHLLMSFMHRLTGK
jgi:hypothetical protein